MLKNISLTAILAVSSIGLAQADVLNLSFVQETNKTPYQEGMEGYGLRWDVTKIGRSGAYFRYAQLESELTGYSKDTYGVGGVFSFGPSHTPKGATQNRRPFDLRLGISYSNIEDAEGNTVSATTVGDEPGTPGLDFDVGLGYTFGIIKIGYTYGVAQEQSGISLGFGF